VESKAILIEINDGVAVLKINRPESLNALSSPLLDELGRALDGLEHDPAVKAVLLTSSTEKAFVAGGDLKEMSVMDPGSAEAFSRKGQELMLSMHRMKKPIIAAVSGYALGGGFELALGCDFIYASEDARFGLPEVSLGVIPGFGGTQNLVRSIGPQKAKEMILSGKVLSAAQAREWGIVNEVLPAAELMTKAMERARLIAGYGSLAVAAAKRAIADGMEITQEEGLRRERALFAPLFATHDQKEGMRAFLEKRKPDFKDR
jgi:enoyl-CoA hydratase